MHSKGTIKKLNKQDKANLKKYVTLSALDVSAMVCVVGFGANPAFAHIPTLDGNDKTHSAYIVEEVKAGSVKEYYTKYTVQEKQDDGSYLAKSYGILLKKQDGTVSTNIAGILDGRIDSFSHGAGSTDNPRWEIQENDAGMGSFELDGKTFSVDTKLTSEKRIEYPSDDVGALEAPLFFAGQDAESHGGAIYNVYSKNFSIFADFVGNSAMYGGAIANSGIITALTGDFVGNSAGFIGGAINNDGMIDTLVGDFIGNSADSNGGAIANDGTITNLIGNFIGNGAGSAGGAIYNFGTIDTLKADFINNSTDQFGGAIYHNGTIENLVGDFIGNSAVLSGGAIYNDIVFNGSGAIEGAGIITNLAGDFIGNSAGFSGGAIFNRGMLETLVGDFIGNSAGNSGGAIYNAEAIIALTGDFIGNSAGLSGGAIFNREMLKTLTGDFIGNSAQSGGAIYNDKYLDNVGTITTLNGDFINNSAGQGGAIASSGHIGNLTGDFINNSATEGPGGAIDNAGTIENLSGDFIGNSTDQFGGAIYNNGTITTLAGDFTENAAKGAGGAILNNGTIRDLNGDFISNSAEGSGGAIANSHAITTVTGDFRDNSVEGFGGALANEGTIASIAGNFIGNSAVGWSGGAIYNTGTITALTGDFIANSADDLGGAIANAGNITLVGDSRFTDNTVEGLAHDIANTGTLNIGSADEIANVTFDGGITQGRDIAGNIRSGNIVIGSGSRLIADFTHRVPLDEPGNNYAMIADQTIIFEGSTSADENGKIGVVGVKTGDYVFTHDVLFKDDDGALINNDGAMLEEYLEGYFEAGNELLVIKDFITNDDGSTIITVGLSGIGSNMNDSFYDLIGDYYTSKATNGFIDIILDDTDKTLSEKEVILEGAVKLASSTGLIASINSASGISQSNIDIRTGMNMAGVSSPTENYLASVSSAIILPGNHRKDTFGVWFTPMYKHTDAHGFRSGNFEYGYESNLYGLNLGADYSYANGVRLGIATGFGGGSSDSRGDFKGAKNDFDHYGATLYAAKNSRNFGLSFDLGYAQSNNDMKQAGGVEGDTRAHLISTRLKTLYRFNLDGVALTPFAAIRYGHYHIEGYDAQYDGATVLSHASVTSDIWEFPVGVEVEKSFGFGCTDWTLAPRLGVGIKFAAGDLESKQDVRIPGVAGEASLKSDVADAVTFQTFLSLNFVNSGNTTLGFEYSFNGSEHLQSHGVNAVFRYEF